MKKIALLTLFVLFLVLAGCGSTSQSSQSSAPAPTPTVAPTATPTPTPAPMTAAQIMAALKGKGLPVGETFVYDENTDPNHLLGRPGQYTSKSVWKDTRVQAQDTNTGANISVSDGGSIEVCANATDAQKRFKYIQAISTSGAAMFAEYEYVKGDAILRVSSQLTPSQAKAYADAFKQIVQ